MSSPRPRRVLRAVAWSIGDIGWLYRLSTKVGLRRCLERLELSHISHGPQGIEEVGHRRYVGGRWERAGRWQLEFMRSQGLKPHHHLVDIGCGALRGGVHFIRYLDPGHYLGVDKERLLIEAGAEQELDRALRELKKPQLVVSSAFDFEHFAMRPDYALAQSVFTHLPPGLIAQCLRGLREVIPPHGVFFATYHESEREITNPEHAHDHRAFRYTRRQMLDFGRACGWRMEYRGVGEHPRGQSVVKYMPC